MSLGHISRYAAADVRPGDRIHRLSSDMLLHTGEITGVQREPLSIRITYHCTVDQTVHTLSVLPSDGITLTRTPQQVSR